MPKSHDVWRCHHASPNCQTNSGLGGDGYRRCSRRRRRPFAKSPLAFRALLFNSSQNECSRVKGGKGFSQLTCCSTRPLFNTSRDKDLPVWTCPSARFGFKPARKGAGGDARALATQRRAPQSAPKEPSSPLLPPLHLRLVRGEG